MERQHKLDVLVETLASLAEDKENADSRYEQGMGFAYEVALRFLKEALGQEQPDYKEWLFGKDLHPK